MLFCQLINCIFCACKRNLYYYKYLAVKLSAMYRIPLDDYNSNLDIKFNTCSSTRNCN